MAGLPFRIVHFGSLFRFAGLDGERFGDLLYVLLREKGFFIWEARNLFLTTAHTDAHLDALVRAVAEIIAEMQEAELLPLSIDARGDSLPRRVTVGEAGSRRLPLTEAQREMWAAACLSDNASCAYNEVNALRLRGALDVEALRQSLQALADRHEALRLRFAPEGDYQIASPRVVFDVPLVGAGDGAEVDALIREEGETAFDLTQGPLVRARIVRLGEADHVLLLAFHHLAYDGWSLDILLQDLVALYDAVRTGCPADLPPATPYGRYAHEQAAERNGEEYAEAEAFWRDQFATLPLPLELPTDRPRPATRSHRGGRVRHMIDGEVARIAMAVGAQHGATPFATLLAVMAAFLHRMTGQDDLVIGVTTAGQQTFEGGDRLVGHCVNLLPLRVIASGELPFEALLTDVRGRLLDALDHRGYTFGTLVRQLNLRRDPSCVPLVEVVFNLDKLAPLSPFGEATVEALEAPKRRVHFDLVFNFEQGEDGLDVVCDYNADLFEAETIRRWLGSFEQLMRSAADGVAQPVVKLEMLTSEERRQFLTVWNDTARDYPLDQGLHHLIEAQVERSPDAVAVRFEGQHLTYADLDAKANQLAHYLQAQGVMAGQLVGIAVERSLEMVVGILGILKAGGAYVPIDPSYPEQRVAFMLEDAQVRLLLTQEHLVGLLPQHGATVVRLDSDWGRVASHPTSPVTVAVKPDDPAYMIYTSGSTGRPKGALNRHRGIVNRLLWMQEAFGLTSEDRVLQKTPFGFDVSVWEFFWPLMQGATLVVARPEGHKDAAYLEGVIAEEGVTTVHFVPPMLRAFLEGARLEQCGSLRRVVCSGEVLPLDLVDEFYALSETAGVEAELHNLYGPTEAAVDVTHWACRRGGSAAPFRSAARWRTPRCTCSTRTGDRCRWACPVSSTWAGCRWARGTGSGRS